MQGIWLVIVSLSPTDRQSQTALTQDPSRATQSKNDPSQVCVSRDTCRCISHQFLLGDIHLHNTKISYQAAQMLQLVQQCKHYKWACMVTKERLLLPVQKMLFLRKYADTVNCVLKKIGVLSAYVNICTVFHFYYVVCHCVCMHFNGRQNSLRWTYSEFILVYGSVQLFKRLRPEGTLVSKRKQPCTLQCTITIQHATVTCCCRCADV